MYADLRGSPPTLCMTSTRDHCLSGTTDFHCALLRAGVDARLMVFDAMPHAFWYRFDIPESKEALEAQASFSTSTSADAPMMTTARVLVCCFGLVQLATAAGAAIKTTPGELIVDHPTLINLGFEWLIEGDDNRNARVDVSYRKQGETQWKQGLPLLRLQRERIYQNQGVFDVISPNMFAGSILDLEPGTAYEAKFVMADPDGFTGQGGKAATRTVTVRTRPEPMPFSGGRVYHVYPPSYKGTKIEPSFDALMCAYNYYCGGGDTVTAGRPRVKPGDIILVHAGLYNIILNITPATAPSTRPRLLKALTISPRTVLPRSRSSLREPGMER